MKHRRFVLVGALACTGFVAIGAGLVHLRSQASWQAMQESAQDLAAARTRGEHLRMPLWGQETDDSAARHYDEAVTLAAGMTEAEVEQLMADMKADDRATHSDDQARARWRPVLDAIHLGAHATDATRTLSVCCDPETGAPDLLVCRRIAFAAVLEARSLRQEGRGLTAVELLLDLATFGNDLGRRGTMVQQIIGNTVTAIATFDAWPKLALAELDSKSLDVLAAGLARLDERMTVRISFDEDLILLARNFATAGGQTELAQLSAWRYGFSTRWMLADAFHRAQSLMVRLDRPARSWAKRQAMLEHELDAIARSTNPVLPMICPSLAGAERGLRESLAQLRLLRTAIELQCGRKPQPLNDPLGGGPLLIEKAGSSYTVCSVGERGGKPIERHVQHLVEPQPDGK